MKIHQQFNASEIRDLLDEVLCASLDQVAGLAEGGQRPNDVDSVIRVLQPFEHLDEECDESVRGDPILTCALRINFPGNFVIAILTAKAAIILRCASSESSLTAGRRLAMSFPITLNASVAVVTSWKAPRASRIAGSNPIVVALRGTKARLSYSARSTIVRCSSWVRMFSRVDSKTHFDS
jgi:hypothetical protein